MRSLAAIATTALFTLAIAATTGAPARAASAPAPSPAHVKVTLGAPTEMSLVLDPPTVPAGPVIFDITNKGAIDHELVILRTDTFFDAIPAGDEEGKVSEDGHIDEVDPVAPGRSVSLTETLAAGNYALICDKAGHYGAGMRAAFTVTTPVSVALTEMKVGPAQTFARAGGITFAVTNAGAIEHELVVVRTDTPDGALRADPAKPGQVVETGSQGEAEDIAAGATTTLTLTLPPGAYALICNSPGHYAAGMHTSFTVLPTLERAMSAAIDRAEAATGIDPLTDAARVNVAALLAAPGVKVTDLDRAAIAAGIIPRAVASDGSLVY